MVGVGDVRMGDFDPVSWDTRVAAIGPPAPEITEYIEQLNEEILGDDPYEAVKTIHDALYEADVERTVPNPGEPFVTAYLLEQEGIISPEGEDSGSGYQSIVERRPTRGRLRELFWEREYTLWWIGLVTGVHPSLVTYWCYEYDIPLMERNYTDESMKQIRAYRESTE